MSEEPERRSLHGAALAWYVRSRRVALFWALFTAFAGIVVIWNGIVDPGKVGRAGVLSIGALLLVVSWVFLAGGAREHVDRRIREGELDGARAVVFRLSRKSPIAIAVLAGLFSAFMVSIAFGTAMGDGGWFAVLVAVASGALALLGVRGVLRRPRILATADEIAYHGIDYEARLPWTAVQAVEHRGDVKRPYLRISAANPGELTRRQVWPIPSKLGLDVLTADDAINIVDDLLRPVGFYLAVLSEFVDVPREQRVRLVTGFADGPRDQRAD